MKTMLRIAAILLLMVVLLLPAGSASARGLSGSHPDGRVIFGEDYVLKEGDTLQGDLVVFGGNVTLETGSTVRGSLAIIGGNVEAAQDVKVTGDLVMVGGNMSMDGRLAGNMVMVGGHAELGQTSIVDGDITTVGGNLEQAEGSQVRGDIIDRQDTPTITIPDRPEIIPPVAPVPNMDIHFNPFGNIAGILGQAIFVGLMGVIASLFLQPQMERVDTAILAQPVMAGSLGLLAFLLSLLAIVIMGFTLILIPVSVLGVLVLMLAWLFGTVAIGHEVGLRLARQMNQAWAAPAATGIGSFLVVLVAGIIGLIPCVGWLAALVVGMVGIGGVVLTYFGSRIYPQAPLTPVEVPPAS